MFTCLGRLAATHPRKICAAWLAAAALLTLVAPDWDTRSQDDDIRFLPDRCDSVRGYKLLEQAFPQDVYASRAIFTVERPDRPLTDDDFALVDRCVAELNRLRADEPELQIGRVYSHRDPFVGKRLVSADGQCTLIQVSLATPFLAIQTALTVDRAEAKLRQQFAEAGAGAPRLLTTGPAGIGRDLMHAGADGLDTTTLATVLLVVVVLLWVYRSPLLALVPLLTIALSCWVALKLLALFTLVPGVYLVNISKVFAIVLLYGAGTDYCLFLVSRYREELAAGQDPTGAVGRSVRHVGGALAASAGTVICGLGLMGFAEFAKVRCAGPAIAVSLVVALAASLTLTPAVLHLLGKVAFWPRGLPEAGGADAGEGRWGRISRFVVARPALVWGASLAVLLPLALYGLTVKPNYRPTGELAPITGSVQGLAALQRHFTPGEVGPVTVLLTSSTDWNGVQGRRLISQLSNGFARLDNVAEVRSLTQPLGEPLIAPPPAKPEEKPKKTLIGSLAKQVRVNVDGVFELAEKVAQGYFVAKVPGDGGPPRYVTRLDVVLRTDPFAPESAATVGVIQTWLREELPRAPHQMGAVGTECYGVTVNARDLAKVTESDRLRVNVLVLGGIFLILLALVRRLWLAGYLLVTVLVSYLATLGVTALAGTLWTGRPLGEVDWRVPFFLFILLVAVGEDYNILLITRALRERRRHGPEEGMRRALARTGGTITSCGVIMAGTFATLMLGGLGTLVQMGFALAFGVLLDTFVVRPFLVPALTLLVWRLEERRAEAVDAEVLPPWRRAA